MLNLLVSFDFQNVLLPVGIGAVALLILAAIAVVATAKDKSSTQVRGWLSFIIYLMFAATILVLSLTSIGSILKQGHMNNYALIAHASVGGVFVVLLVAIAWIYLPAGDDVVNRWRGERWTAWALVWASLLTAGSMVASMLPIFGTQELLEATQVHRFAGLATAVALLFHSAALLAGKLGYR
jgi:hypothetical protein